MHVILEDSSRNITCHDLICMSLFSKGKGRVVSACLPIWYHFHLTEDRTPSFQSLSGISRTDLRILDRGGPKFTQYNVETVFQLIASTSSQFSVMHGASIPVNLFKERGYRLSLRHISESRRLCKRGTGFRPLEGGRKKCKFEQVFYLVDRRKARQVSS